MNRKFSINRVNAYEGAGYPQSKAHAARRLLGRGSVVAGALLLGTFSCDYQLDEKPVCGTPRVECEPGNVAHICQDDGTERTIQCETWCNEQFGIDAYATGCSADIDSPCTCETDILDGYMGVCEPDDFTCVDEETVTICVESAEFAYETVTCDELCTDRYGEEYFSDGGCDPDATENPCQCVSDLFAGVPAQFTPGDFFF